MGLYIAVCCANCNINPFCSNLILSGVKLMQLALVQIYSHDFDYVSHWNWNILSAKNPVTGLSKLIVIIFAEILTEDVTCYSARKKILNSINFFWSRIQSHLKCHFKDCFFLYIVLQDLFVFKYLNDDLKIFMSFIVQSSLNL